MHARWQAALPIAALISLSAVAGHAAEAVKWQNSFSGAKAAAKKSHKLMLVDFYADW